MWMNNKLVFSSIYTSYFLNVLVKRSVTYALPDIAKSEGLDKNQMGLILSVQLMAYAGSKLACGMLVDIISPQMALAVGLILQGITAVAFSNVTGSITMFTLFWLLNGVSAGTGWPACIKILTKVFRKDQLGTAWSVLSTSMNVAGTAGPLLTAYIITHFGWRTSIALPGYCVILMGLVGYFILDFSCRSLTNETDIKEKKTSTVTPENTISRLELFKLPGYGSVCFAYGLVSFVQYAALQWVPLYLVNDLGHSIMIGNSYTSAFEVGGMLGSLVAGYYSDHLLTKTRDTANSMIRLYVVAWFTAGLFLCLVHLTWFITPHSPTYSILLVAFGIGVCIYGPVSILGVAAMECAPDNRSGLAHSLCSFLANVGQTAAGLPLGFIIKQFGWNLSFYLQLAITTAIAVHLFYFTQNCTFVKRSKKEQ